MHGKASTTVYSESQINRLQPTITLLFNTVSPPSVPTILKGHEEEFFECVNAKYNMLKLKRKEVISPSVLASINGKTDEEAQEILYDHLLNHATVESLREWCEWAIAAQGYPKMQELGRKMKDELA